MVRAALQGKKIKKHPKPFNRHQSDRFKRVDSSWRKPKGIDSCVRRRFRGTIRMPKIGYGTDRRYKHVESNGFIRFVVHNMDELRVLMMHNEKYSAEIASSVGNKLRTRLLAKAKQLDIKVTNPNARVRTVEKA